LNEPNQHDRESEDQQDMNEPAEGIGTDDAEKPEQEQDDEECPEHFRSPWGGVICQAAV
jgi:hypothetical protein